MGRILAIDYGHKRCGIAETDPMRIIASGLTTVPAAKVLNFIEEYCQKEKVDVLVVGESLSLSGAANPIEREILGFIDKFKKKFPEIEVVREDERFTSKMAMESMIAAGSKKKDRRDKGNIDMISATIILQQYLEKKA
ncbi:MAG: Holliday junction resolvase RuvX [Cryomorphaceae bacterium]|nr:Holliday junction resolvase RuvX [Cryomorphaceae bacterium]